MKVKQLKKQMDNIKEQCNAGSTLPHGEPSVTDQAYGAYIETNTGASAPASVSQINLTNSPGSAPVNTNYGNISISNSHSHEYNFGSNHTHTYSAQPVQVQVPVQTVAMPQVHHVQMQPTVDYSIGTPVLKLGSAQ